MEENVNNKPPSTENDKINLLFSRMNELEKNQKILIQENKQLTLSIEALEKKIDKKNLLIEKLQEKNKTQLIKEIKNTRSEMNSRIALHKEETQQQFKIEALERHNELQAIKKYAENIVNDLALMQQAKEPNYKPMRKRLLKSLNQYSLSQHPFTLDFIAKKLKRNIAYQEELLSIIYQSRDDETIIQASVNSMTLLKASGFCFIGKDFSRVRVPGVDLSNTMLMRTNFTGADLTGIELSDSNLVGACFKEAILNNIYLGASKIEKYEDPGLDKIRLVYSSSGQKLVLGNAYIGASLWSIESTLCEKPLKLVNDYDAWVFASSSSGQLALGSYSGELYLWTFKSETFKKTLDKHSGSIICLAYSPNGKKLATNDGGTTKIWDTISGDCLKTLELSNVIVSSFDGEKILVRKNEKLKFLEISSGICTDAFIYDGLFCSFVYSPNGEQVALGGLKEITLRSILPFRRIERTLIGHTSPIKVLAFSPRGDQLASASEDGTLKLWHVNAGLCLASVTFGDYTIKALRFTLESSLLEFTCEPGDLQVGLVSQSYFHPLSITLRWEEKKRALTYIQAPSIHYLDCKQLELTGAIGLSQSNLELLKQYGALGEPSDQQPPPKEGVSILSTSTNPQSFLTSKNNASKRSEKKNLIESGNFLEFN